MEWAGRNRVSASLCFTGKQQLLQTFYLCTWWTLCAILITGILPEYQRLHKSGLGLEISTSGSYSTDSIHRMPPVSMCEAFEVYRLKRHPLLFLISKSVRYIIDKKQKGTVFKKVTLVATWTWWGVGVVGLHLMMSPLPLDGLHFAGLPVESWELVTSWASSSSFPIKNWPTKLPCIFI